MQLSQDQQAQFTINKIDMDLKCLVINDEGEIKVIPSNAEELNYYGKKQQSTIKLSFKLTPTNYKKDELNVK